MFGEGWSSLSSLQTDAESSTTTVLDDRILSSELQSCCASNKEYSALDLCEIYGHDCTRAPPEELSEWTIISDDEKRRCKVKGAIRTRQNVVSSSFVGISFSTRTNDGMPYSYQLCDQFPMENLIDRAYDNIMSMDENGWLVGGGYKNFDPTGKFA